MKRYSFNKILGRLGCSFIALSAIVGLAACDNVIYDFEENCDPEDPGFVEEPNDPKPDDPKPDDPKPSEPEKIRIFIRTNPGSGGTSSVYQVDNLENAASTSEGVYVSIDLEYNDTYTLTAAETNPDYKFVRWHDDTNDGDLTEGMKEIPNVVASATTHYTAIFDKIIQEPEEPEEPEEAGKYYVKYVFDKNMQFTDGFSQRVNSVDLYVFNTNGSFITRYHEEGAPLKNEDGYLMELKDLPAGEYEFIAWCGLANNNDHFTVPTDAQISRNDQVECRMSTSSDATHGSYQSKNLAALFHGRKTDAKYEESTKDQIQTVYLTKNTNNINITLQHKEGLEFDKSRFTVTMHDKNDVMKHDNSMHPDVTTVQYRPYRVAMGTTSTRTRTRAEGSTGSTTGNFMQVELSTARLMANNDPIVSVYDNETGKTIFSIPLVKWALQLRSTNYKGMDDQEYLDREDNYNMMLWLDSNKEDGWFGAEININDWHVIDDVQDVP